ncbi:hypothetical protein MTO96_031726 [Rhipicephalus appendiculatus]
MAVSVFLNGSSGRASSLTVLAMCASPDPAKVDGLSDKLAVIKPNIPFSGAPLCMPAIGTVSVVCDAPLLSSVAISSGKCVFKDFCLTLVLRQSIFKSYGFTLVLGQGAGLGKSREIFFTKFRYFWKHVAIENGRRSSITNTGFFLKLSLLIKFCRTTHCTAWMFRFTRNIFIIAYRQT